MTLFGYEHDGHHTVVAGGARVRVVARPQLLGGSGAAGGGGGGEALPAVTVTAAPATGCTAKILLLHRVPRCHAFESKRRELGSPQSESVATG